MSPLLSQYIKDKEKVLFSSDTGPGFFAGSPKSRRQAEVIQKLAEMIGTNVKLYDMTLQVPSSTALSLEFGTKGGG